MVDEGITYSWLDESITDPHNVTPFSAPLYYSLAVIHSSASQRGQYIHYTV